MNRAYTSASKVKDLRQPDRHTPMKVLVKNYGFVELLWAMFVSRNKADLTYVLSISILFLIVYRRFTGNLTMKIKVVTMVVIETS